MRSDPPRETTVEWDVDKRVLAVDGASISYEVTVEDGWLRVEEVDHGIRRVEFEGELSWPCVDHGIKNCGDCDNR